MESPTRHVLTGPVRIWAALLMLVVGAQVFVTGPARWEGFPADLSPGLTVGILAAGLLWALWRTRSTGPVMAEPSS